jgi:hypothetical protein
MKTKVLVHALPALVTLFCTVRNFLLRAASAWLRVAFMAIWAIGILAAQAVAAVPCLSNETVSLSVSAPGPIAPHDPETVNWDLHGANVKCDVSLLRLYYRDATTGILRLVVEQHFPVPSSGSVTERPQSRVPISCGPLSVAGQRTPTSGPRRSTSSCQS